MPREISLRASRSHKIDLRPDVAPRTNRYGCAFRIGSRYDKSLNRRARSPRIAIVGVADAELRSTKNEDSFSRPASRPCQRRRRITRDSRFDAVSEKKVGRVHQMRRGSYRATPAASELRPSVNGRRSIQPYQQLMSSRQRFSQLSGTFARRTCEPRLDYVGRTAVASCADSISPIRCIGTRSEGFQQDVRTNADKSGLGETMPTAGRSTATVPQCIYSDGGRLLLQTIAP